MECGPRCCNNKINTFCYGGGTTIDCCASASVWIYHWTRTHPMLDITSLGMARCGVVGAPLPRQLVSMAEAADRDRALVLGGGRSGKMVGTSSSGWKQLDRGIL